MLANKTQDSQSKLSTTPKFSVSQAKLSPLPKSTVCRQREGFSTKVPVVDEVRDSQPKHSPTPKIGSWAKLWLKIPHVWAK